MQIPQEEVEATTTEEQAVTESATDGQAVVDADLESESEATTAEETDAVPALPRLVVKRNGSETEESFTFAPPATIGRFDPSVGPVDIDLGGLPEGQYVSRKHAKIVLEEGVYKVCDLGSSNGTYVLRDDFVKVDEAEITDGTEIALGNARFVFHI